jgi:hypothetical protein
MLEVTSLLLIQLIPTLSLMNLVTFSWHPFCTFNPNRHDSPTSLRMRVSVRKVVPTLTSKSAEIYLLMVGAKQLVTPGLSWFRPGPYVQQWCARGTILRCTVVLAEGATSEAERRPGLLVPEVFD